MSVPSFFSLYYQSAIYFVSEYSFKFTVFLSISSFLSVIYRCLCMWPCSRKCNSSTCNTPWNVCSREDMHSYRGKLTSETSLLEISLTRTGQLRCVCLFLCVHAYDNYIKKKNRKIIKKIIVVSSGAVFSLAIVNFTFCMIFQLPFCFYCFENTNWY